MRKSGITLLLFSILISLYAAPTSAASVKPGAPCPKVNATLNTGNIKLICKKNGKNLIWAKIITYGSNSQQAIDQAVADDWAKWRANKINGTPDIKFAVEQGYSDDWVNETKPLITYGMNVLNGNGLKLVPTPFFAFGDSEDFRKTTFDGTHCNAPYMPNMEMVIYCASIDLGSGGLRLGRPGISMTDGYKLNEKDKGLLAFVNANELAIFYEAQAQYGDIAYNGLLNQIPAWIRAGLAQNVGVAIANDYINSSGSLNDFRMKYGVIGSRHYGLCDKDLQDYEGKNKQMSSWCTNSQNYFAVQLLIARHGGFRALFNFPKYLGDVFDWPADFKQAFGISREDFYNEWYNYLGLQPNQYPVIRAPTPAEHY
jgi:hypothetical protein